jgi:F420-0:gamma-glutamyl ligase
MPDAVLIVGRPSLSRRAPFANEARAVPVRTRLIDRGEDVAAVVAQAVAGTAAPDDVVCVSETAVAIAQGRAIAAETIRPSRLAYLLSRRAGALATINQPESLQLVIDQVGPWRVVAAAAAHVLGRAAGRRGVFYALLGEAIATIDGYTGTMPPFERTIVLGPADPDGVARAIAARCGAHAAVVDANDLGIAKVLGASANVARDAVARALRGNPHGNGDEQTPVVVLKWRGSTASPLTERAA